MGVRGTFDELACRGQYSEALHFYEEALLPEQPEDAEPDAEAEHNNTCRAGMARMLLKLGQIQR